MIYEDKMKLLMSRMNEAYTARQWNKFHSPKNLVMDLGSEVGELLDEFRWLSEEESISLSASQREAVKDEIGDVFMVLAHLSHKLGIDPLEEALKKLSKVEKKYPVEKCRGKSDKYTAYED